MHKSYTRKYTLPSLGTPSTMTTSSEYGNPNNPTSIPSRVINWVEGISSALLSGGGQFLLSFSVDKFGEGWKNAAESAILAGSYVTNDFLSKQFNYTPLFNPFINSAVYTISTSFISSNKPAHIVYSAISSLGMQAMGKNISDKITEYQVST